MKLFRALVGSALVLAFVQNVAAGDVFDIDRGHSYVGFSVKHMMVAKVRGEFTDFSGKIEYDAENVENSSVSAVIKTASITTESKRRDDHLKNPDFFDVENYPEIKFESTSVKKRDDGFIAVGNLTIRDVTKQVEIPFEVLGVVETARGKRMGIEAVFTINRQDYNVKWSRAMDNGGVVVSDEVKIEINLEARGPSKEE